MRRRSIDQLVYDRMYPRPKPSDPANFHAFLTHHLVFEVRQEVHSYFGHLDTQEAKYPGLDYSNPAHRRRLCRWPLHRQLFAAFDALHMTPAEIASLTKWEGTKWAKERFEKEHGITIPDTTADGMPDWREPGSRWRGHETDNMSMLAVVSPPYEKAAADYAPIPDHYADDDGGGSYAADHATPNPGADELERIDVDEDCGEDSDGEIESIGLQLNERLLQRVAAHNAGDMSQPLDEDWEQWLKNALEEGNLDFASEYMSHLPASPSRPTASSSTRWRTPPATAATSMPDATTRRAQSARSVPPPPPPPAAPSAAAAAERDSRRDVMQSLMWVPPSFAPRVPPTSRPPRSMHAAPSAPAPSRRDVASSSSSSPSPLASAARSSAAPASFAGHVRPRHHNWHRVFSGLRLPTNGSSRV